MQYLFGGENLYAIFFREVKTEEEQGIQPEKVKKNDLTILIAEDNESNYKLYNTILGNDYWLLHGTGRKRWKCTASTITLS